MSRLFCLLPLVPLLAIVVVLALGACTTPLDGQNRHVDPKAWQIFAVPF